MLNWFRKQPYGIQALVGYFIICFIFYLMGHKLTVETCLLIYNLVFGILILERLDKK